MTVSAALRKEITQAVAGVARGPLVALGNFKKNVDGGETTSPAAVSTKMFADTRTLAASATENLDLAGVLTGFDGAALTFTKIHAIYVKPVAANTNSVVVGGAAANGFVGPFADATDKVSVGPDETFLITSKAGWTVTAGTADILKVANSAAGSAVTYDIVIIGE